VTNQHQQIYDQDMYNTKNRNRCDKDEATTTLRTEDVGASLR
jgi:hypothetical protein